MMEIGVIAVIPRRRSGEPGILTAKAYPNRKALPNIRASMAMVSGPSASRHPGMTRTIRTTEARSALSENLVELLLDALGLFLDIAFVDIEYLQRLEIGRACRRRDVDAGRIAAVGGEDLLGVIADHEFREQLGGIRMRRVLHYLGRRRNDEDAIGGIERLDLMTFLPEIGGVGIECADRDQALAALEHIGNLLVALHDHDVVAAQLLVVIPAVELRDGADYRNLQRGEGRVGHHQL